MAGPVVAWVPISRRSDTVVRQQGIHAHSLPDQSLLLFDSASGTSIPVNESGAWIWKMCDGCHTVEQIVAAIGARYDAEPSQIDRDTGEFLGILISHGFIQLQR